MAKEMESVKDHDLYYVKNASEITDEFSLLRFMILYFKMYNNMNFHIDLVADPENYMQTIQEAISDCDHFMRRSKIALPFKSELTEEVRTKEMDLLSATTELHGKLINLHLGFSSLELIENRSDEQSQKLGDIKQEASETFSILKSIGRSMIEALNENFKKQLFYEDGKEPVKPQPTRRDRRKKKPTDKT
jgi:hypothetical protein